MMKAIEKLPAEYEKIYELNLQKDKKTAILVNGLALVIAAVMGVAMHFFVPVTSLFDMEKGLGDYFLRFAVLLLSSFVYIVLHELVHGVAMKAFGTKKVKYGFTGIYAFAGSDDYYGKKSYLTIALAPVVLFAILFAVINPIVPREWFWVVYILQICNISGAAGDLYVTVRFAKMPKNILVNDSGVGMTVYAKHIR